MKLSYFALGVLLGIVWLALESVTAHAQIVKKEPMRNGDYVYYTTWKDPDTGCVYITSQARFGTFIIGAPRLRADGKPDCPQVDKK
jgi:hypothetical protein